ncbi:glycosyltransferase family 4 protein [Psychromonas ossibalaenae]|uniref:glycosyltransferase family 4 protein n=1 Tax=Psychromonas ossibalaenae TaxID=444922 RepID=UPI000369A404|nr:glycosyltransferase family 1 protein [Psychromonas ossibalaenae]
MATQKLNIAVFIGSGLQAGGGFQYEYMVLKLIKKYNQDKYNFKFYSTSQSTIDEFAELELPISIVKEGLLAKVHRIVVSNLLAFNVLKKIGLGFSYIERKLSKDNIDLLYFLSPNTLSQAVTNIPYIFTLWDLGHFDILEFPEVSNNRIFEFREQLYTKSLKRAMKVTVDSYYGKEYTLKKYNLDPKRVEVLPFLPNIALAESKNINIKDKYQLNHEYIFYPAQFWAHKNHIYILKALRILKEEHNILLDVVFCGSDKGNLQYILNKAEEYGIAELIHYIGFAPSEDIPALYEQSLSLVMPTYLGPTNIPPLEAFAYKTPVCYSDLPCFREQVKDAAFFIDLAEPKSLVNNLLTIMENTELVQNKVNAGSQILDGWSELSFYTRLENIFNEYSYIRECWE